MCEHAHVHVRVHKHTLEKSSPSTHLPGRSHPESNPLGRGDKKVGGGTAISNVSSNFLRSCTVALPPVHRILSATGNKWDENVVYLHMHSLKGMLPTSKKHLA